MDSHEQALLRALASAMHLTRATELEANQVNEVAALLQLPLEGVPILVTRLQNENLLRLHWGGRVALTSEGRARAEGPAAPGAPGTVQIRNIGAGAHVVFGSPGAVVGHGAMGAGAVHVDRPFELGDLVAALHALRRGQEDLSPDAKATAQQLGDEVAAITHAVQQPQPDRKSLAQRLDQATTLLGKLTSFAEAAQQLGPTLPLLSTAFEVVRRWILGG